MENVQPAVKPNTVSDFVSALEVIELKDDCEFEDFVDFNLVVNAVTDVCETSVSSELPGFMI